MKQVFVLGFLLVMCFFAIPVAAQSTRLIGWWRMDETNGAKVITDASGNGRHATLGTGVSIVDGRFGKATRYDGTGNAWASFSLPSLSNMTISAWVYMDGTPNNILPRIMQLSADSYFLMPSNAIGQLSLGVESNNWGAGTQDIRFSTNKWFLATVVYRQEYTNATDRVVSATFYLNGIRCGDPGAKLAFKKAIPAGNAFLANNSSGAGALRGLIGMLDEVRLYDGPLSEREVYALFQNQAPTVDAGRATTTYRDTVLLQGRLTTTNTLTREQTATARWNVVSAPEGAVPILATPEVPATTVSLPVAGTYVFRLTASNALAVVSNDVTVIREAGTPPENNVAPSIALRWSSTNVVFGTGAPLAASVTDDGLPGPVRFFWKKMEGPGATFFDNAFTTNTTAYFSTNGSYTLALIADDGARAQTNTVTVTVAAASNTLNNGLLHWWRMNEPPSTTKKSYDSAGTNTLTLMNQAVLQTGKTGYGLRTPKETACAQAIHTFTNAQQMTFSAWIYYDNAWINNPYMRLINSDQFYILYNLAASQLDLSSRGIGTGITNFTWTLAMPKMTTNQWIHFAVLFDRGPAASGTKQVMYINGVRYLTNPTSSNQGGSTVFPGAADFVGPLFIGGNGGNRNFDGVIDEVRVYNRFLTDEEVRLLATDPDNNHAPAIELPETITARITRPVSLPGVVTDDGQPFEKTVSTTWSVVSGDASKVLFEDATQPATSVTFLRTGDYVLKLFSSDGEASSAALTHVTVLPTGTIITLQ